MYVVPNDLKWLNNCVVLHINFIFRSYFHIFIFDSIALYSPPVEKVTEGEKVQERIVRGWAERLVKLLSYKRHIQQQISFLDCELNILYVKCGLRNEHENRFKFCTGLNFFRSYFHYCSSSVHHCKDHFHIHFINRCSHI